MFKNLKRIVYQVSDMEAARNWYSGFLEQEPAFESPVAVIFKIADSSLSLTKAPGGQDAGTGRLAAYWEVDDVDQAYACLCQLGATEISQPVTILNIRTAQVLDPFGNTMGLTGEIKTDSTKTIENQASETAHAVALCRALASRDTRFGSKMADPYSELFLSEKAKLSLQSEMSRNSVIDRMISRPLYGYFIARSAFFDEAFNRALRNHVPQIVFLGAGYDTRALRFRDRLGITRIYELDAVSTQNRKISCLQKANAVVPAQVSFVGINFKTENFVTKLQDEGFDASAPALFIWEGVTYYLSQEVLDRTIELMRDSSGSGVGLCFDYMSAKLESINAGEPFLSWMDPAMIETYLERYGFRLVDHLDAVEMGVRYLTMENGSPAEKPISRLRLVYAER